MTDYRSFHKPKTIKVPTPSYWAYMFEKKKATDYTKFYKK